MGATDVRFDSSEAVRDAALPSGWESRLSNAIQATQAVPARKGVERIADTPIYQSDLLVRRSLPLQKAGLSKVPSAQLAKDVADKIGLVSAGRIRIVQGTGACIVDATVDEKLPANTLRVPTAQLATVALGSQSATLTVERA
jgi:NADH-quinone oxidoreductase subunit G